MKKAGPAGPSAPCGADLRAAPPKLSPSVSTVAVAFHGERVLQLEALQSSTPSLPPSAGNQPAEVEVRRTFGSSSAARRPARGSSPALSFRLAAGPIAVLLCDQLRQGIVGGRDLLGGGHWARRLYTFRRLLGFLSLRRSVGVAKGGSGGDQLHGLLCFTSRARVEHVFHERVGRDAWLLRAAKVRSVRSGAMAKDRLVDHGERVSVLCPQCRRSR